jgi:hypothetical protein
MGTKSSIDQLNSFLRGELSAVESYRMALDKLDKTSTARTELLANLASHEERVAALRDAIRAAGGEPSPGSGAWGAFVKVVESTANVLGDKVAIAALEEGEDHGLRDYRSDVNDLDPQCQTLVANRLLPAQQQTHDRLSSLKKRLS